jgi:hypothetical protein
MMVFHRFIVSDYFGNVDMGIRYRLNLKFYLSVSKGFYSRNIRNYNSPAKYSG